MIRLKRPEITNNHTEVTSHTTGAKVALWSLRNYEDIVHFWKGFSWLWVIGILLSAVVGYLSLSHALCTILLVGVIANSGVYLGIRAIASHLKDLQDGPEKDEAHELMIRIIRRRVPNLG